MIRPYLDVFLGIALHEALGMDIKWRSARHSAAMNQLELSEIEKTLRFVVLFSEIEVQ